ncbi:DUF3810 domain-containing protein [Aminipila butyrica]|uniref:DUF3810 domain-containing protein n=1 Tax=Aminipila butyrica TaxID=433296 RepID=A0A858BTL5_9FIRM|nr:DUF3810 domain-containing protein [Aminipila butyrica]QIB68114.1 DUF3810 domain-containing protein [Aminipila butyrica]
MSRKLLTFFKIYPYALLYGFGTPLLCAGLILLVRTWPQLGQLYAAHIFPFFPNSLGRILSLFPFSVLEMDLYLLVSILTAGVVLLLTAFAAYMLQAINKKAGLYAFVSLAILRAVPKALILLLCLASTAILMLTLACGLNYSREGIASDIGIFPAPAAHQDLVQLSSLLIADLQETIPLLSDTSLDTDSLHRESTLAMENLGFRYPTLSGYYPKPKPVLMSSWMSQLNLTGLFSPYTIEANYNNDVLAYIKPYTICHELAHLKGYIREDEAGFIAYLACSRSSSPELRYSGTLNALSYVLAALYEDSSQEEYQQLLLQLPERALADLTENNQYWDQYQGSASRLSAAANDTYLKANAQANGIQSYGQMVDLLLAYYGLNNQSV